MNRIMVTTVAALLVLATAPVSAGTSLSGFSVDSGDKTARATPAVAKTPQGGECRKGIIVVKARSKDEFVLASDEVVSRKQLEKALRKRGKRQSFDCIVVDGGNPTPEEVNELIRELTRLNVNHVEWSGIAAPKASH